MAAVRTSRAEGTGTGQTTLVAAAVVLVLAQVGETLAPSDGPAEVAFAQTPAHLVLSLGEMAGFILLAFAFGVLHRRQAPAGVVEGVSYALAAVFAIMAAGGSWGDAFLSPAFAQLVPAVYGSDDGGPAIVGIGYMVTFLGLGLFAAVYGVVSAVLGRLPRVGAILLAVGAAVTAVPVVPTIIPVVVLAAGLVWMAMAPARRQAVAPDPAAAPLAAA